MSNEQPRTPAGSPEGGQFSAASGAESTSSLMGEVGARVDDELRSILEQVMVDKKLGDPTNASGEETIRAAIDYMSLPDFDTPETQARWALEDVRNASELDLRQVRGQFADEEFVHERLARGEMVPVEFHDGTTRIEGEAFRSATPGKVWFIADDPYPDAYRDRTGLDEKLLAKALKSRVTDLNIDPEDVDNDFDLLHEAASGNDQVAQTAWDYALGLNGRTTDLTVGELVSAAKEATSVQRSAVSLWADTGATSFDGRPVVAFRNSARPDHMWVIPTDALRH